LFTETSIFSHRYFTMQERTVALVEYSEKERIIIEDKTNSSLRGVSAINKKWTEVQWGHGSDWTVEAASTSGRW